MALRIKDIASRFFGRLFRRPRVHKTLNVNKDEESCSITSDGSSGWSSTSICLISSAAVSDDGGDSVASLDWGTHCHTAVNTKMPEIDKKARRKLIIASILCLLFAVSEAVGGVLAGSLAIATDSAHMFTDFASFMISLLAIYLASRPPTTKLSFGWYRAEILGALISVVLIWIVTGVLVYMAVQRVINQDYKIEPIAMIITASCAVVVNIILRATLHGVGGHGHSYGGDSNHSHKHDNKNPLLEEGRMLSNSYGTTHSYSGRETQEHVKKKNLNIRTPLIHVIGDFIQSIGVLVAAIIIYFKPQWKLADPICTFLFSILVLISTLNILKDTVRVLMEATPQHIEFTEIKEALMDIDGVKDIHNLRIWSLTITKATMSVHLTVDGISRSQEILDLASRLMWRRFDIQESTIQIEQYALEMDDCDHCQDPVVH